MVWLSMRLDTPASTQPRKKVTLTLPFDLIESTRQRSNKNFSETVEEALREANHRWACQELMKLRGKVDFHVSWQEIRSWEDDE